MTRQACFYVNPTGYALRHLVVCAHLEHVFKFVSMHLIGDLARRALAATPDVPGQQYHHHEARSSDSSVSRAGECCDRPLRLLGIPRRAGQSSIVFTFTFLYVIFHSAFGAGSARSGISRPLVPLCSQQRL